MSRSFKKVPIIKDATWKKFGKKYANKKVRKIDIDNGGSYKKVYESWNICDYCYSLYDVSKRDGIPAYYHSSIKMTYNEIMKYWRK